MDLFGVDARDTADQFTNLAQGRGSITSALELLNTGKSQSYDKALGKLGGEIRERWSQAIRPKPVGLPDFSKPDFSESAEGLLQFLERVSLLEAKQ